MPRSDGIGDLHLDTEVAGGNGSYGATLSGHWQIWGPMGGYLSAIALRAAAREAPDGLRPASVTAQFLSVAQFADVEIEVTVRRSSSRTALISASLNQRGTGVLDLQVWFAPPCRVIEHDHVPAHAFGHPEDHHDISVYTDTLPSPFWRNFEYRPAVEWIDDWATHPAGFPEWASWMRYRSAPQPRDHVLEACRLLVLADLPSFPAAIRAHPKTLGSWISPSLDLAVQFHRLDDLGDWLLVHGETPLAHKGLMAFRSDVWTSGGRLAASGSGQLACRSVPPGT